MGGCRCSYKNCTNTTKSPDNIHFFHYPVKYRDRCVQWIENACKPNFYDLEEEQLRNKVVCEVHFEQRWFPNSRKKRLLQGAIPTLDGAFNYTPFPPSPMDSDAPVYLPSNQYNDVKVVPANDDGTVFILDTENMFTVSPKIESYIIKNGVLVPTNFNNSTSKTIKANFSRIKASPTETEVANINTSPGLPGPSKMQDKDSQFNNLKTEPDTNNCTQETDKDSCNIDVLVYENREQSQRFEIASEVEEKKPFVKQNHVPQKTMVSKSYLRQIKQHSRDIASIKRMLKQKRIMEQKPTTKTVLNFLQQHIPPTLQTVVSLLLGETNELSDDDVEFFTAIHRTSPEVYHLLSEKYKWNLPSVDIVDPLD